MSDSCSSKSGRCAFCGEQLSNTSAPIPVAYGAPSDEGRGTFSKLKPLRWRFLSNKAPRTKFMCGHCAEKRQKPQVIEQPPFTLDSSWSSGTQSSTCTSVETPQQREERNHKHRTGTDQALRLDHLREPRDNKAQQQKREKLQEEQRRRHESLTTSISRPEGRRRGSSQGVLQPIGSHRMSRESMSRQRQASAADIKPRTSIPKQQRASVESATRPRRSSSGRSEPRGSEKKGQRLSSTAEILGMSRSLELPPNYFEMSSKSPNFCAASAPEGDSPMVDWKQLETHLPQVQPRKQNETEEERQRRRSASYAHMLLRMRRHYDAVQVSGANGYHPATAPPRRIRAERRAQSVAVRNAKDELVMADLTKEEEDPVHGSNQTAASAAIDLDYLRAFKDAR